MLTTRTVLTPVGDARTQAMAQLVLMDGLAPSTFHRQGDPPPRADAMWLGTADALRQLGVERGTQAMAAPLAQAWQGRHAKTHVQVIRPGWSPALGGDAVRSHEITFWAPGSVSVIWSHSEGLLRQELEQAMMAGADVALAELLASPRFAAAAVLHAVTQAPPYARTVPPPVLHVHCYLVGVTDPGGQLASSRRQFGETVRSGGAAGRLRLAEKLRGLGFQIEALTGPGGRFFEVAGVPPQLAEESSVWHRAECPAITHLGRY
ncbi:relaxase domain-containing protein [Acrocarpospora macrocephala]|uniref:relaxase domain-containing protein n=1 Tax=Acrocarpospora macrocephala TaxID=150177 RepID=UPI0014781AC4|nr:relaxase domain-containing protein [Acrocarpospora macrocephala]